MSSEWSGPVDQRRTCFICHHAEHPDRRLRLSDGTICVAYGHTCGGCDLCRADLEGMAAAQGIAFFGEE